MAGAIAFSLVASGIYILNDIADRDADRRHPVKTSRPVAAGTISVPLATRLMLALLAAGLAVGYWASPLVAALLVVYTALNIGYSYRFKQIVLLDVFVISSGFLLRILAGTLGIGIQPSGWLLLCGLLVTLLLGFAKRRAELGDLGEDAIGHRAVLGTYDPATLDHLVGVMAACTIMSYSLYTMSPGTLEVHGTANLIYTVPFVVYGICRFIFLLRRERFGGDAPHELLADRHMVISVIAWAAVTVALIA